MKKLSSDLFSKENILDSEKMQPIVAGNTDVTCDDLSATGVDDGEETCADEGVVGTHLWDDIVNWVWPKTR